MSKEFELYEVLESAPANLAIGDALVKCFHTVQTHDKYRPLFWFTNADKAEYDEHYGIEHSDCYRVWGMTRTGCAGCPYGKDFETELALAEKYEPKFHKAMLKVFGESYEYTRQFLEFRKSLLKGG